MTTATVPVLPLGTIEGWAPCAKQMALISRAHPAGVPLTTEAALALHERGVDVLFGMLRLLTDEQRVAFILFTLRQRQPHIVSLLRDAGMDTHADAVAALEFDTPEQADEATPILEGARDAAKAAARAASWDASMDASWDAAIRDQVLWVAERITERLAGGEDVTA